VPDSAITKPPKAEGDRLNIPLDKDGRIDFGSMRDKTREKVKKIVSDPATARELGLDTAPAVQTIPRELVMLLVTAIGQLDLILIQRTTQADPRIVAVVGSFTPEEGEAIAGPLENVLNKYTPAVFNRYGDEVALAGVLLMVTLKKIEAVRAAVALSRGPAVVIPHPSAPAPASVPPVGEDSGSDVFS